MKKIINIEIVDIDYDLDYGFSWIRFTKDNKEYTLQACLSEREECKDEQRRRKLVLEGKPIYKKEIDRKDDGMDDGICLDANKPAFDDFGSEECRQFFYSNMRKIGIR